jgi:hypothetical protein
MIKLNELLNEDMQDAYQIYMDLDGCLSDFEERFEHFSGLSPSEYRSRAEREFGPKIGQQKFWDLIDNQVGMRFYRGMKFMPEGQELWNYIKQYNPIILTAPSRNNVSIEGKTMWVEDNLGDYEVIFRKASEKCEFAGPNQILIDDNYQNIMDWKAQNGIGLLYNNNLKDILTELNKLGL